MIVFLRGNAGKYCLGLKTRVGSLGGYQRGQLAGGTRQEGQPGSYNRLSGCVTAGVRETRHPQLLDKSKVYKILRGGSESSILFCANRCTSRSFSVCRP